MISINSPQHGCSYLNSQVTPKESILKSLPGVAACILGLQFTPAEIKVTSRSDSKDCPDDAVAHNPGVKRGSIPQGRASSPCLELRRSRHVIKTKEQEESCSIIVSPTEYPVPGNTHRNRNLIFGKYVLQVSRRMLSRRQWLV
jgi:hypothetical protein